MNITYQDDAVMIIDNFLSDTDFNKVLDQLECESYKKVELGHDKVYKLNAGDIYKSKTKYWYSKQPWNNNYEPFIHSLASFLKSNNVFEFNDVSLMVHAYLQGAGLGWHSDNVNIGAFTFYCHREWRHTWGGSLLVSNNIATSIRPSKDPLPGTALNDMWGELYSARGATFDLDVENELVMDGGIGHYVLPLPNRLAIIKKNVFHKVDRVDQSAGENCRVSLTGFFR